MHHKEPAPLQHLIQKIIQLSPHQDKIKQATIINAWNTTMPEMVKRETKYIDIKNNKICIEVTSAPLRQELQNNKKKILDELQRICKYEMTDIIFTVRH